MCVQEWYCPTRALIFHWNIKRIKGLKWCARGEDFSFKAPWRLSATYLWSSHFYADWYKKGCENCGPCSVARHSVPSPWQPLGGLSAGSCTFPTIEPTRVIFTRSSDVFRAEKLVDKLDCYMKLAIGAGEEIMNREVKFPWSETRILRHC